MVAIKPACFSRISFSPFSARRRPWIKLGPPAGPGPGPTPPTAAVVVDRPRGSCSVVVAAAASSSPAVPRRLERLVPRLGDRLGMGGLPPRPGKLDPSASPDAGVCVFGVVVGGVFARLGVLALECENNDMLWPSALFVATVVFAGASTTKLNPVSGGLNGGLIPEPEPDQEGRSSAEEVLEALAISARKVGEGWRKFEPISGIGIKWPAKIEECDWEWRCLCVDGMMGGELAGMLAEYLEMGRGDRSAALVGCGDFDSAPLGVASGLLEKE